ncbi:hypothetical protein Q7P37_007477 [Cladosporium fusiforme]
MSRALVLHRPRAPTEGSHFSSNSTASSYTMRAPFSTYSQRTESSYGPPRGRSPPRSLASNRYPARNSNHSGSHAVRMPRAPSEYSGASSHVSSSKDSAYSTQTFGSPNHAGYARCQAPRRYFKDGEARWAWDNAPVNQDGVKTKFRPRDGDHGTRSGSSATLDDLLDINCRSHSGTGGGCDDDTVVPGDSISCAPSKQSGISSQRSRASREMKRSYHYPRSRHSQGHDLKFEQNGVEVSNGKFVKVRTPDWVPAKRPVVGVFGNAKDGPDGRGNESSGSSSGGSTRCAGNSRSPGRVIGHLFSESYDAVSREFEDDANQATLTLSTHGTFALTCIRGDPVADAMLQMISVGLEKIVQARTYRVKAMPALADYDGAVIARELAFAACAFEVDAADATCVVGLLGQVPLPGCHGSEGVDGDLHCGDASRSLVVVAVICAAAVDDGPSAC